MLSNEFLGEASVLLVEVVLVAFDVSVVSGKKGTNKTIKSFFLRDDIDKEMACVLCVFVYINSKKMNNYSTAFTMQLRNDSWLYSKAQKVIFIIKNDTFGSDLTPAVIICI